jgi:hypothetical protein
MLKPEEKQHKPSLEQEKISQPSEKHPSLPRQTYPKAPAASEPRSSVTD